MRYIHSILISISTLHLSGALCKLSSSPREIEFNSEPTNSENVTVDQAFSFKSNNITLDAAADPSPIANLTSESTINEQVQVPDQQIIDEDNGDQQQVQDHQLQGQAEDHPTNSTSTQHLGSTQQTKAQSQSPQQQSDFFIQTENPKILLDHYDSDSKILVAVVNPSSGGQLGLKVSQFLERNYLQQNTNDINNDAYLPLLGLCKLDFKQKETNAVSCIKQIIKTMRNASIEQGKKEIKQESDTESELYQEYEQARLFELQRQREMAEERRTNTIVASSSATTLNMNRFSSCSRRVKKSQNQSIQSPRKTDLTDTVAVKDSDSKNCTDDTNAESESLQDTNQCQLDKSQILTEFQDIISNFTKSDHNDIIFQSEISTSNDTADTTSDSQTNLKFSLHSLLHNIKVEKSIFPKYLKRLILSVFGGDGTQSAVMEGLVMNSKSAEDNNINSLIISQIPIGIVPFGTGNDLSRSLGWGGSSTANPKEIVMRLRAMIESASSSTNNRIRKVDQWLVRIFHKYPNEGYYRKKVSREMREMYNSNPEKGYSLPLELVGGFQTEDVDSDQGGPGQNNNIMEKEIKLDSSSAESEEVEEEEASGKDRQPITQRLDKQPLTSNEINQINLVYQEIASTFESFFPQDAEKIKQWKKALSNWLSMVKKNASAVKEKKSIRKLGPGLQKAQCHAKSSQSKSQQETTDNHKLNQSKSSQPVTTETDCGSGLKKFSVTCAISKLKRAISTSSTNGEVEVGLDCVESSVQQLDSQIQITKDSDINTASDQLITTVENVNTVIAASESVTVSKSEPQVVTSEATELIQSGSMPGPMTNLLTGLSLDSASKRTKQLEKPTLEQYGLSLQLQGVENDGDELSKFRSHLLKKIVAYYDTRSSLRYKIIQNIYNNRNQNNKSVDIDGDADGHVSDSSPSKIDYTLLNTNKDLFNSFFLKTLISQSEGGFVPTILRKNWQNYLSFGADARIAQYVEGKRNWNLRKVVQSLLVCGPKRNKNKRNQSKSLSQQSQSDSQNMAMQSNSFRADMENLNLNCTNIGGNIGNDKSLNDINTQYGMIDPNDNYLNLANDDPQETHNLNLTEQLNMVNLSQNQMENETMISDCNHLFSQSWNSDSEMSNGPDQDHATTDSTSFMQIRAQNNQSHSELAVSEDSYQRLLERVHDHKLQRENLMNRIRLKRRQSQPQEQTLIQNSHDGNNVVTSVIKKVASTGMQMALSLSRRLDDLMNQYPMDNSQFDQLSDEGGNSLSDCDDYDLNSVLSDQDSVIMARENLWGTFVNRRNQQQDFRLRDFLDNDDLDSDFDPDESESAEQEFKLPYQIADKFDFDSNNNSNSASGSESSSKSSSLQSYIGDLKPPLKCWYVIAGLKFLSPPIPSIFRRKKCGGPIKCITNGRKTQSSRQIRYYCCRRKPLETRCERRRENIQDRAPGATESQPAVSENEQDAMNSDNNQNVLDNEISMSNVTTVTVGSSNIKKNNLNDNQDQTDFQTQIYIGTVEDNHNESEPSDNIHLHPLSPYQFQNKGIIGAININSIYSGIRPFDWHDTSIKFGKTVSPNDKKLEFFSQTGSALEMGLQNIGLNKLSLEGQMTKKGMIVFDQKYFEVQPKDLDNDHNDTEAYFDHHTVTKIPYLPAQHDGESWRLFSGAWVLLQHARQISVIAAPDDFKYWKSKSKWSLLNNNFNRNSPWPEVWEELEESVQNKEDCDSGPGSQSEKRNSNLGE